MARYLGGLARLEDPVSTPKRPSTSHSVVIQRHSLRADLLVQEFVVVVAITIKP